MRSFLTGFLLAAFISTSGISYGLLSGNYAVSKIEKLDTAEAADEARREQLAFDLTDDEKASFGRK